MLSNTPVNTDIFRNNLFITDLDGTLLDGFAKVSNTSARIISDLSHRGALISVATARTPATVDPLLTHTFTTLPAIVLTGAAMWNRVHRCYQDTRLIDSDAAAGAVDALRSAGINPFIYSLSDKNMLNVFYNGAMSPREEKFANDRRGLALKRFRLNEPTGLEHYIPGTILIFAIGRADIIFEQAERLGVGRSGIRHFDGLVDTPLVIGARTADEGELARLRGKELDAFEVLGTVVGTQVEPFARTPYQLTLVIGTFQVCRNHLLPLLDRNRREFGEQLFTFGICHKTIS